MRKLLHTLGIEMDKDAAVISVKPANPKSIDDEMHHPALQLFFTEKVGWEREEVYYEQKNLFIFTLLVLSMYESESFQTPFSKLPIQSRQWDHRLTLRSEAKEYVFSLRPILYELLKFVSEIPGRKENIVPR